jgi:hypothetical protein
VVLVKNARDLFGCALKFWRNAGACEEDLLFISICLVSNTWKGFKGILETEFIY